MKRYRIVCRGQPRRLRHVFHCVGFGNKHAARRKSRLFFDINFGYFPFFLALTVGRGLLCVKIKAVSWAEGPLVLNDA